VAAAHATRRLRRSIDVVFRERQNRFARCHLVVTLRVVSSPSPQSPTKSYHVFDVTRLAVRGKRNGGSNAYETSTLGCAIVVDAQPMTPLGGDGAAAVVGEGEFLSMISAMHEVQQRRACAERVARGGW
jgi:hypothetical protein